MSGFCCKCGRKIIDPDMVFNKFGDHHAISFIKLIEIDRRYKKRLCAKCDKKIKKRGVRK